ncbi:MAG: alpha/beta hydrolase [Chitinophagaceae bacterium]|nr:alpha/beta hydrolase [Oligoflexus sp.]
MKTMIPSSLLALALALALGVSACRTAANSSEIKTDGTPDSSAQTTAIPTEASGPYIIKDSDYNKVLDSEILPFMANGRKGYFEGVGKRKLEYALYEHDNAKASIVIVHGYTQSDRSFGELVYTLWKNGYTVNTYSQIGHGCSENLLLSDKENLDAMATECKQFQTRKIGGKTFYKNSKYGRVHVDVYERYIDDMKTFMTMVKNPALKTYLYCHSMGGGVCARALEMVPNLADAVFLSSPMLRNKTLGLPYWAANFVSKAMVLAGPEKYGLNQKDFAAEDFIFGKNTDHSSKLRFDSTPKFWSMQNGAFRSGSTTEHVHALIRLTTDVVKPANATRVTVPVFLNAADPSLDRWVELRGDESFCGVIKTCKLKIRTGARHEIYNEVDSIRLPYIIDMLEFFADPSSFVSKAN